MSLVFIDLAAQQKRLRPLLDAAIGRVLDHGQYIMGPEIEELESQLAHFSGAKHVITCSNGTQALVMSLMALGLKPGEAVFVPSFTFVATAEAVVLAGGVPVFVDVCPKTFALQQESLDAAWAVVEKQGLRAVGVIAVDLFGQPACYTSLKAWSHDHQVWLLADAAQSFGASHHGAFVGTLGHVTTTSFFPAKPLGCYGEGGAIFTQDPGVAEILRSIRVHGQGKDKYHTLRIGVNGRLETLQAAILLQKMTLFPQEIVARQAVARRYTQGLEDLLTTPVLAEHNTSVWAQYTLTLPPGFPRGALAEALKAVGIPTAVYYPLPLHTQPVYQCYPRAQEVLPVTESLCQQVLSLPMHAYLSHDEQDTIIKHVRQCFQVLQKTL